MDYRYENFGNEKVYVFDLRKWIVVNADNQADAEDAAYGELFRMMQEDMEPWRDVPNLELTCLGRKVFDSKTHQDVFLDDEQISSAVLAGEMKED